MIYRKMNMIRGMKIMKKPSPEEEGEIIQKPFLYVILSASEESLGRQFLAEGDPSTIR